MKDYNLILDYSRSFSRFSKKKQEEKNILHTQTTNFRLNFFFNLLFRMNKKHFLELKTLTKFNIMCVCVEIEMRSFPIK